MSGSRIEAKIVVWALRDCGLAYQWDSGHLPEQGILDESRYAANFADDCASVDVDGCILRVATSMSL